MFEDILHVCIDYSTDLIPEIRRCGLTRNGRNHYQFAELFS